MWDTFYLNRKMGASIAQLVLRFGVNAEVAGSIPDKIEPFRNKVLTNRVCTVDSRRWLTIGGAGTSGAVVVTVSCTSL